MSIIATNGKSDDISRWISGLQAGDARAAQAIWDAYFEKLLRLARRKFGNMPRRVADEEDIVLSAINSFIEGATAKRFPKLEDHTDIWKLLVTITARKVIAQRRRLLTAKGGAGLVRGESVFAGRFATSDDVGIGQILGSEPTPQFATQVAEEFELLLEKLKNEDRVLHDIALWKLEGFTNSEIAEKLECNVRTVERKLALIRKTLSVSD